MDMKVDKSYKPPRTHLHPYTEALTKLLEKSIGEWITADFPDRDEARKMKVRICAYYRGRGVTSARRLIFNVEVHQEDTKLHVRLTKKLNEPVYESI